MDKKRYTFKVIKKDDPETTLFSVVVLKDNLTNAKLDAISVAKDCLPEGFSADFAGKYDIQLLQVAKLERVYQGSEYYIG